MLQLNSAHADEIRQIGEQTYPHECCGLLVGSLDGEVKIVSRLIPAENERTDSPANRYLITAGFLHETENSLRGSGSAILGFFHSHPDVPAQPSQYDQDHAWPWYSYLIVSVREGESRELLNWKLRDDRSAFEPEGLEIV